MSPYVSTSWRASLAVLLWSTFLMRGQIYEMAQVVLWTYYSHVFENWKLYRNIFYGLHYLLEHRKHQYCEVFRYECHWCWFLLFSVCLHLNSRLFFLTWNETWVYIIRHPSMGMPKWYLSLTFYRRFFKFGTHSLKGKRSYFNTNSCLPHKVENLLVIQLCYSITEGGEQMFE